MINFLILYLFRQKNLRLDFRKPNFCDCFYYFCTQILSFKMFKMKKLSLFLVLALSTLFALAQNGRIDLRSISSAEITHSDLFHFACHI